MLKGSSRTLDTSFSSSSVSRYVRSSVDDESSVGSAEGLETLCSDNHSAALIDKYNRQTFPIIDDKEFCRGLRGYVPTSGSVDETELDR